MNLKLFGLVLRVIKLAFCMVKQSVAQGGIGKTLRMTPGTSRITA